MIPADASLKRIAWAYGVAKKGSAEEHQLFRLLIERVRKIATPVENAS